MVICCGQEIPPKIAEIIRWLHVIGWIFIVVSFVLAILGLLYRPNKQLHDELFDGAIGIAAGGALIAFVIPGILLLIARCCCKPPSVSEFEQIWA